MTPTSDKRAVVTRVLARGAHPRTAFLIQALDDGFECIVLVGRFARDRCFAAFVRETCPAAAVIVASERAEQLASRHPVFA